MGDLLNCRKAQASIEYLMTYGWAVLALMIVIGVLYSGGYFNVDRYLPDQCSFIPDFPCDSFKISKSAADQYKVELYSSNGFGTKIKINNFNLTGDLGTANSRYSWDSSGCTCAEPSTCTLSCSGNLKIELVDTPLPADALDGETIDITYGITGNENYGVGDAVRLYLIMNYTNCAATADPSSCDDLQYSHLVVGTIRAKVEPSS